MNKFISVILPIYKVESYLHKSLDSVLSQTWHDIEIILVDDGSPDSCPTICDKYASKDVRIKVIHKKNGGLSSARNAGLEVAQGDYVCFVDSDDILHPQYCELLLKGIEHNNSDICACNMERFYDTPNLYGMFDVENLNYKLCSSAKFLSMQITAHKDMGVCNRLFSKKIFDSIRFKEGYLHEDVIFAGDLIENYNGDVALIDLPLYHYRQRSDSIVNTQTVNLRCSPDRVFAGEYLFNKALESNYPYIDKCFQYSISHPWTFIDKIYVTRNFKQNKDFFISLQSYIRNNEQYVKNSPYLSEITKKRMLLFSKSAFLYGFNAYARLLRVYIYRLLKKDAYKDGHGI